MIYKTLIIFDTNRVRHTEEGDVCYHSFILGGEFNVICKYLQENGLSDLVHIGIPRYVMDELLQQKIEQFVNDVEIYNKIGGRLEKIGGTHANFSKKKKGIRKLLKKQRTDFFKQHSIKLLTFPKKNSADILSGIMRRAIEKKSPFKQYKKVTDGGFKDVLIWETVLNSSAFISKYDSVIFFSNDGVFAGCKDEFEAKFNRKLDVFSESGYLTESISAQYAEFIDNKEIYQFAKTEYFREIVEDNLKKSKLNLEGRYVDIEDFKILEVCKQIEKEELEDYDVWFKIYSRIMVNFNDKKIFLDVSTTINDAKDFIGFEIDKKYE